MASTQSPSRFRQTGTGGGTAVLDTVRTVLPFVRPYRRLAALSLVLLVGMAAAELSIPRLVRRIIDEGIGNDSLETVLVTSGIMLLIAFAAAVCAIGNNIFSVRTGESVARDLRERQFVRIQRFSFGNIDSFTTGNLMVRLSSDTAAVQRLVQVTLRIGTRAPLMMIGSLLLMFRTDAGLALKLLPLLAVTGAVIAWFSLRMEPLFTAVQKKLDGLNTVLQENIAGVRVVKAFVRTAYERSRFERANEGYTAGTEDVMRFMATMTPVLSLLVNLGIVTVVWAGGLDSIRGRLSVGSVVAFTNYLLSTMGPLTMMGNLANTWSAGIASMGRIAEVLGTEPEVADAPDAVELPAEFTGRVSFEHVSFRYRTGSYTDGRAVLEDISFTAEPGETVAILGATGAGKSTLVKLIPRFYDVSGGRILFDGTDIRRFTTDSLLSAVGIVPQESVLFSGTVAENIRYGRPDASDEEVETAARAAAAHEFILSLPAGYDTRVEERGVNLSGGQKQRIAIARAVLTRPRILILDDSTSSVDTETETRIQRELSRIMRGRTCFVVAQRISTVLTADKIIVLDRGRIAACGTHAELLGTSRIYREIYDSQLGALETEPVTEAVSVMEDASAAEEEPTSEIRPAGEETGIGRSDPSRSGGQS
jgi:ATP-binding cassette subfamily B multidrug efflux pump